MFKNLLMATVVTAIATLFMGCFPEEDSCNIMTAGIYVEYEVMEQNNNATAKATFWTGDSPGGTYLELGSCGDEISVNGVVLGKQGSNPEYYQANVDVADVYDFTFTRPDEGDYVSTVNNMPATVEITSGPAGDVARDEEFQFLWTDNDDGQIDLLISGDCFDDYPNLLGDDVADNGSHTVGAGAIEANSNDLGESCAAEIRLTRDVNGSLSSDLKGTIQGFTRDTSSFTSTPAASETE